LILYPSPGIKHVIPLARHGFGNRRNRRGGIAVLGSSLPIVGNDDADNDARSDAGLGVESYPRRVLLRPRIRADDFTSTGGINDEALGENL
jgi:hypothetical protein